MEAETHNFTIENLGGNEAKIVSYVGPGATLDIPGYINGKKIVEIGERVFSNRQIKKLTLPDTLRYIGYRAFYGNHLTTLTIPGSVHTLDRDAFKWNDLETLNLQEGLFSIGPEAFWNNQLTVVSIPRSVKEIGKDVFLRNTDLHTIKGYTGTAAQNLANDLGLTFIPRSELKKIDIISLPNKLNYINNEELDTTGLKVRATFLDGSTEFIGEYNLDFTGYHFTGNVYAQQTVRIKYLGKETTFNVNYGRFRDVQANNSFHDYIVDLFNDDIINGYSDGTFKPNNPLTRAQAAVMIVRAAGISTDGVSSNFKDVSSSHNTYKFISAAYEAGIINGYKDGTFKPNDNVTFGQIATMVVRAFNLKRQGNPPPFVDVEQLSSAGLRNYIYTLASLEVVKGYGNEFRPNDNVTRGQFSKIVSIARGSVLVAI